MRFFRLSLTYLWTVSCSSGIFRSSLGSKVLSSSSFLGVVIMLDVGSEPHFGAMHLTLLMSPSVIQLL